MIKLNKDSEQATKDKANIAVLQDNNATARAKDDAFSKLYGRHSQQIRIYFLKRLRDTDVAEDLLMITFVKVHKNINSYDTKMSVFSTWLYKIAKNSFIDYSRKARFEVISLDALQRKTSENNDGMEFQLDSKTLNPLQIVILDEVIKEVSNAINSIEDKKIRDLIICRYIYKMSFEEAAKTLGLKLNSTLRTAVARGKYILKKKLVRLENNIS